MKIKISNVAKILEADISMKGVTVIAGVNNSGKSTVLKSIYMGLNSFSNLADKISIERKRSINSIIRKTEIYFDDNGYFMVPKTLLDDLSYLVNDNIERFLKKPDDYDLFKKLFLNAIESYKDIILETNNKAIFSDGFIRPIFDKLKVEFVRPKNHYHKYISTIYLRNIFNNQFNNTENKAEAHINFKLDNIENKILVINNKIEEISDNITNGPEAIYLPTYNMLDYINGNRWGRINYSPESDLRNNLADTSLEEQSLEEYLEIEDNIKAIKEILEEVVHGKLIRTPSGELRYKDNEVDNSFSMGNVASGMKNFLIIQSLVEKGKLKKNSILLIDEPETNLHPEWHLIFAEILVLMNKYMGVISVVNSHSPYFIRAIEVKLADHDIMDKGTYYLMEKHKNNMYLTRNVTSETNKIYEKLYKPLEYL